MSRKDHLDSTESRDEDDDAERDARYKPTHTQQREKQERDVEVPQIPSYQSMLVLAFRLLITTFLS